jgi:hypothetical protein
MGAALTADALLTRHAAAWQAATVHPFLAGVRDGSVPEDSFDRWLAQDYLFAQALVRAQSRITAGAPFADVGLLAGGVVATVGELGWFEEMAARRSVALDAPMHPANRAYCDFLLAVTFSAYPAQIPRSGRSNARTWRAGKSPAQVLGPTGSSLRGGPPTASGPTSATSRLRLIASLRHPSASRHEKLRTPSSG